MKPQPQRNTASHLDTGRHRPPRGIDFPSEQAMPAINRRSPPVVAHRRYPSLSDDDLPPMFSVRAIALIAIVAILLALAVVG